MHGPKNKITFFVRNSCTEFHPNRTKNSEITDNILFAILRKI